MVLMAAANVNHVLTTMAAATHVRSPLLSHRGHQQHGSMRRSTLLWRCTMTMMVMLFCGADAAFPNVLHVGNLLQVTLPTTRAVYPAYAPIPSPMLLHFTAAATTCVVFVAHVPHHCIVVSSYWRRSIAVSPS